jgi:hypothetical protein
MEFSFVGIQGCRDNQGDIPKTPIRLDWELCVILGDATVFSSNILESCVRYSGRPLSVAAMDTNPIVYPFEFGNSLAVSLPRSSSVFGRFADRG